MKPSSESLLGANQVELTKACHPILRVPGSRDPAVLHLVDVDRLDADAPAARGKTHECALLRGGDAGTDNDLAAFRESWW
jgi:hypothetical protein